MKTILFKEKIRGYVSKVLLSRPDPLLVVMLAALARFAAAGELPRIVSLGPYATENIVLLGMEKNIAGVTIHDLPERREGRQLVGTLLDPSIEKILTLKPCIVVASREGNRPEPIQRLESLGIRTLVLDELYTFEDICRNLVVLGDSIGAGETARKITGEQRERLAGITGKTGLYRERKRVFFILGFKPLFTTGSQTYINEMISLAGGENLFRDVRKKWFSCSAEEVIRRKPEYIVFLRMEEEQAVLWDRLRETPAVKNRRFAGIEPTVVGSPTPKSFVDSVEYLYGMMYPE